MQLLRFWSTGVWLLSAAGVLLAQPFNTKLLSNLEPRAIGPAGMSGRITAIDVVQSEPDIIYAGAASGGVWRSDNGGTAWVPIFDKEATQSIGAIAINQNNPSDIWVGTGEGNPRNSQNTGGGIYRSRDGGKTWQFLGLKETRTIHRIIIHRDNPDVVFVAALGSPFGPNPERGVYRTRDGGKTWDRILYTNDQSGCADMVVDPTNPNKIIAALWEYGRKPWTFNSGGAGSGLFVTFDGGDTWEKRTDADGLPKGDLGRIGIAIARSKPNIVYALVEAKENALYKSTDGGFKWSVVSKGDEVSNRPFYYHEIHVDPQNENRIYNLFSLVTRSEDGGRSFQTLLPYSGVHPDHHAFWIHPQDPNYLIEGNDGGLNISRDGGKTWRFAENIPVGQFYHVNYDMSIPYRIGGGMQDNGSWIGPSAIWQAGGIRNLHWQEVYFGDGFDVAFRPDDTRYAYAMSQGGNVGLVDTETGRSLGIQPTHPDAKVKLRFNWNAAFAQDPHRAAGIYYGSQFVHYSKDYGQTWELISPDLTTNDTSKQRQDITGGLTIDNTAAENHTTILAIAPSPVDAQLIWVGTDDGNLQLTRDGGKTWTNLGSRLPGVQPGSWVPYIEVSAKNAGEAFIIVNDYRRNDYRPMAFHTNDFGQTFRRIVDEKQVDCFTLSIVQDPVESKLLWLGTDCGLYVSIDAGQNWNKWMNGYPSVPTADMKIHPREHDLILATFGRAFWIMDDIRPIREIAATGGNVLEQPFRVFQAPDAYLANYKSYTGVRFGADATFEGQNRRGGAMISIWNQPPAAARMEAKPSTPPDTAKKKGKEKAAPAAPAPAEAKPAATEQKPEKRPERAQVAVLGMSGDTIRTFSTRLDTGLVRIYWDLRRNGARFPSRREPRPDEGTPSGPEVLPGTYKVVVSYGKAKDSTMVKVMGDPRETISPADRQARDAAFRDLEKIATKAAEGFDRLRDARTTIKRVETALETAPDSTKQQISKLGKALQDSITQLEKRFMTPEGLKGIQRSSDNLMGTLFQARGALDDCLGAPNQAAQRGLSRARQETAEVLEAINAFFASSFADYQQKVSTASFSLFKEMAPLKLE